MIKSNWFILLLSGYMETGSAMYEKQHGVACIPAPDERPLCYAVDFDEDLLRDADR